MFKELRNDFYDDDKECYYIDGWKTNNDNEPGVIVAMVYKDKVVYTENQYKYLPNVKKIIEETKGFFTEN